MTEFTIDPEFRDLLPPLTSDERERLLGDINKNGCRDALVIWKEWNILIDGHNRYEICTDLDLAYQTTELSFKSRDDVKMWMIRNQLARRNITDAKRVALNLILKPIVAAQSKAKEQQRKTDSTFQNSGKSSDELPQLQTDKEIAKASGVSHDTVHKVTKVMSDGDDTTKSKMLAGEISVRKAYLTVKGELPEKTDDETLDPLTPRQEKSWVSMREEMFDRIRRYANQYPAARAMIMSDLRGLLRHINKRGKE